MNKTLEKKMIELAEKTNCAREQYKDGFVAGVAELEPLVGALRMILVYDKRVDLVNPDQLALIALRELGYEQDA